MGGVAHFFFFAPDHILKAHNSKDSKGLCSGPERLKNAPGQNGSHSRLLPLSRSKLDKTLFGSCLKTNVQLFGYLL